MGQPMVCSQAEGGVAWLGSPAGFLGFAEAATVCGVRTCVLGPGRPGREMAARWSSENVVVEFRDSQVSRRPNGAFWACALPVPLPHAAGSVSGAEGRPPPAGVGKMSSGVAGSFQTRGCEGAVGAGRNNVLALPAGTGRGVCLGTPKRRDGASE